MTGGEMCYRIIITTPCLVLRDPESSKDQNRTEFLKQVDTSQGFLGSLRPEPSRQLYANQDTFPEHSLCSRDLAHTFSTATQLHVSLQNILHSH